MNNKNFPPECLDIIGKRYNVNIDDEDSVKRAEDDIQKRGISYTYLGFAQFNCKTEEVNIYNNWLVQ